MFIDSHTHGAHAERNSDGKLAQPLMSAWIPGKINASEYIDGSLKSGIEKIVLLDPPEVTFELKKIFGAYVIPIPQVDMDLCTPEKINTLFDNGAVGIKFIAPEKPYGDDEYFKLYDVINERKGLAVFHTGFLALEIYEPGGLHRRRKFTTIDYMRPSTLDRIARAFPKLKILMAHFGNPWWEEAWKICASHKNIYADLSGGTASRRSMNMWEEIFAPNGDLDVKTVSKLCFGTDSGYFVENEGCRQGIIRMIDFYTRLMERLKVPEDIKQKIYRENIIMLTDL